MKKSGLIACVVVLSIFLSGCKMSFEAPSDLIKTPIISEKDLQETELIRSFLGSDEKIEIPREMKNPSPTIKIDVDGDGRDEKIVFFAKRNGYQTGLSLLRENENGVWSLYYQDKQAGRSISYFDLRDLSGDGSLELLLGVNVGVYYNLYIYDFLKDGLQVIDQIKYSQLKLLENEEKGIHLITSLNNHTSDVLTTELNVYEWQLGHMKSIFQRNYDGFSQELEVGKVGEGKNGVYLGLSLDLDTIEYSLLLPEEGSYKEKAHIKSLYALSFGEKPKGFIGKVDNKGTLGILSVNPPLDVTKRQARDYLQVWKIWNGAAGFDNVYALMENTLDGYHLKIPVSWVDELSYQFSFEDGLSQVSFYDKSKNLNTQPVFVIQTIENYTDNTKLDLEGYFTLGQSASNHRLYVAKIYQETVAGEVMNESVLKEKFSLEGGQ